MRKRIVAAMCAVVVSGGIGIAGSTAEAADCTPGPTNPNTGCTVAVTAVVGSSGLTGVRTLGAVAPVALAGTSTLTGALAVPVVETAATGVNPWSVTASASDLTDTTSDTITANHLTVADTALPAGVGCLSVALNPCAVTGGGGARALDTSQTLFSVTGESVGTAYTGTYDYSGLLSLAVPNGTPAGSYTGSLTLTLVQ